MRIIIIVLILNILLSGILTGQIYNFKQYNLEQGLSQSQVFDIEQDATGMMWFATYGGGISIFDGQQTRYLNTSDGLPSHSVISLFRDKNNRIWIGTAKGICVYDGLKIIRIDKKNQLANYFIWDITQDINGNILIGTDNGAWKFSDNEFSFISNTIIASSHVYTLLYDSQSNIWFSSLKGGVTKYNRNAYLNNILNTTENILVEAIFEDSKRNVWIGSEAGLYRITDNITTLYTTKQGLSENHITSINEDEKGNLWIGTEKSGLMVYNGKTFRAIRNDQGLQAEKVYKIFRDKDGQMWVATDGGGAMLFTGFDFSHIRFPKIPVRVYITSLLITPDVKYFGTDASGIIAYFGHEKYKLITKNDGLSDNTVNKIIRIKNADIWIGTNKGLTTIHNNSFRIFSKLNGLPGNEIYALCEAKDGKIWIGTYGHGICYYEHGNFTKFDESDGIANNYIWDIKENRKGEIYFATGKGLTVYNGFEFKSYYKSDGLISDNILTLSIDNWDNCWIGAEGISRFDGQKFINYTTSNGLCSNMIYSIIFDSRSNLIVGTEKGIDRIIINKQGEIEKITHYGQKEGFSGIETNNNAVFNDDEGKTWFGTINGVTIFDPWEEKQQTKGPDVIIRNVKFIYEDTTLKQFCDSITPWFRLPVRLVLPYSKNNIAFEFIAFDYMNPESIRYKYILEGFDREWLGLTNKNAANYMNLPAGKYTFKVLAINNTGVYSQNPATFSFTVLRPYWLSYWFIMTVSICFMLIVWFTIFFRTRNIDKKRQMLELKVEKRTLELRKQKNALEKALRINDEQRKKLEKANQEIQINSKLKEQFLANTSHEIRTPLNIMLGFANLLLKTNLDEKQTEYLNNIKNAGNNLLVIINDILDFSKIEANKLHIEEINFDFTQFILSFISMMSVTASEKDIEIKYHIDKRIPQFLNGDPVRLNQILTNLVRNSIKFSNEKGYIKIDIDLLKETENKVTLYFQIIDKGIGIAADQIDKVFTSFNQVSNETTRKFGGTGLGLAITKKIIEMLNGKIGVFSEINKGSTFYFQLDFQKGQSIVNPEQNKPFSDITYVRNIKILLVEDNPANAILACDTIMQFNPSIHVDVAENGIVALERINNSFYDCVIMDIQMPEMDGYEATRNIRNNLTSAMKDVPILGMSAHAMQSEKDKCLSLGMNDYITKPFDPNELIKKIYYLINKNITSEKTEIPIEDFNKRYGLKIVDLAILAKTYRNDTRKILKILLLYQKDIPRQINELQQDLNNEIWQQAKAMAHSLKTSFKYLGIEQAHIAAKNLETKISDNKQDEVMNLFMQIAENWTIAEKEIKELILKIEQDKPQG